MNLNNANCCWFVVLLLSLCVRLFIYATVSSRCYYDDIHMYALALCLPFATCHMPLGAAEVLCSVRRILKRNPTRADFFLNFFLFIYLNIHISVAKQHAVTALLPWWPDGWFVVDVGRRLRLHTLLFVYSHCDRQMFVASPRNVKSFYFLHEFMVSLWCLNSFRFYFFYII